MTSFYSGSPSAGSGAGPSTLVGMTLFFKFSGILWWTLLFAVVLWFRIFRLQNPRAIYPNCGGQECPPHTMRCGAAEALRRTKLFRVESGKARPFAKEKPRQGRGTRHPCLEESARSKVESQLHAKFCIFGGAVEYYCFVMRTGIQTGLSFASTSSVRGRFYLYYPRFWRF